jgi:hypothetical protein
MSTIPDLSRATWEKSSHSSGEGGQCLEFARNLPGIVPVRDSKNLTGPALVISANAWQSFVDHITP